MENTLECSTGIEDFDLYGWKCSTTFENLLEEKNLFFIKCKDQPWLPIENDSQRNINTQDYVYVLQSSKSELKIDSILPTGKIESGFEPIEVNLVVKTSGGAEDGKSSCYYSFIGYDKQMILFKNTWSTSHKQVFNTIMNGEYNIFIECKDIAGNSVRREANFEVVVDTIAPQVVRVYQKDNALNLITNEKATCVYREDSCNYLFSTGTTMKNINGIRHYTLWNPEKIYYVKCKDKWENVVQPSTSCSIIVKPMKNQ